ncbi:NADH oxidase [Synergistales bacterium]|nr:NADH oxidase [Synergistales bacterium]
MTQITDTLTIRGHSVKNRIAMLPIMTFSFKGDGEDYFGQQHITHYTEAAKGGTGLVILQGTNVSGVLTESEKWTPGCQNTLKTIAANAKSQGAVVMIQLACGGGDRTVDVNLPSTEEIQTRQQEMLKAALNAHALGFDGVEYHFAHGFFLCKMLDAEQNRRNDIFGGNAENRARILTDIIPKIRSATGENFIIAVRMGAYIPTEELGVQAAKRFEAAGVDMLDITFGVEFPSHPVPKDFPFGPVTYSGALIKRTVNIPVIGVYGLRSEEQIKTLLEKGYADMAGVARGILADPHFAERVIKGEAVNSCLACKECFWFTDHTKCPARAKTHTPKH